MHTSSSVLRCSAAGAPADSRASPTGLPPAVSIPWASPASRIRRGAREAHAASLVQMPELVWIAHHVNGGDLAVFDLERGGLQLAVGLARDEAGQAVDEASAHELRAVSLEQGGQPLVQFDDAIEPEDRLPGGGALAAAVGMEADIGGEHRAERRHVAVARRGEEGIRKLEAALLLHLEARARLADMDAGAACKLTAGGAIALDRRRHLVEAEAEHVVQQERRALERREALEDEHERQRDVFLDLLFVDDRIGKPGADVGLAPMARRFEMIETEPGHGAAQEGFRFANLGAIGPHPADESLLHRILGIRDRAEHAIGDAGEHGAQRIEARPAVFLPRLRHHAAVLADAGSCHRPKPTAMRFQPLMTLIISSSLTGSSSVTCARRARYALSCGWPCERRVKASVQPSAARSRSV